jgi:glycosidase
VGFNQQTFDWYKKLITIRKENPVLVNGKIEFILAEGGELIYRRYNDNKEITVYFNNTTIGQDYHLGSAILVDLLTGKRESGILHLEPLQAAILKPEMITY